MWVAISRMEARVVSWMRRVKMTRRKMMSKKHLIPKLTIRLHSLE